MSERWNYPGNDFDEELKARAWEQLPQGEKDAMIAKQRADTVCWGFCQSCGYRIEALGKNWPESCPSCGFGGSGGG
jgi:rubrerythrin